MGIGTLSTGATKSFSDDVLKIEVAGPGQQHLSVVDVPGIFRKVTEGVTTQSDMNTVRAMVERYMENSRSVILAVIPANVGIATQDILTMAEVHDPDSQRTLSVLTKPDLVDKGAEGNVLDLMRGTTHKLNLGWSILKNPSQKDLDQGDDFDRHTSEKNFFKFESPWSTLDKDRVGVQALQIRLVELPTEIARREFTHVCSLTLEISIYPMPQQNQRINTYRRFGRTSFDTLGIRKGNWKRWVLLVRHRSSNISTFSAWRLSFKLQNHRHWKQITGVTMPLTRGQF